jgi:hypothetical protein
MGRPGILSGDLQPRHLRTQRDDAKHLAPHRRLAHACIAPKHDVILASQKGEVNLAGRATATRFAAQDVIFASR